MFQLSVWKGAGHLCWMNPSAQESSLVGPPRGREMTGRWHSQVQGPALGSGSTTAGDLKGWRGDLMTSPPCARGLLWVQIRSLQYKFLGEQSCPLQQVA